MPKSHLRQAPRPTTGKWIPKEAAVDEADNRRCSKISAPKTRQNGATAVNHNVGPPANSGKEATTEFQANLSGSSTHLAVGITQVLPLGKRGNQVKRGKMKGRKG